MVATKARAVARAAGFRFKKKTELVHLSFEEGHELHGLTLSVRKRIPTGILLGAANGNMAASVLTFVKQVVSWNVLDDNDKPVPLTVETFGEYVDAEEHLPDIMRAWQEAVATTSAPFSEQSNDDEP